MDYLLQDSLICHYGVQKRILSLEHASFCKKRADI